MTIYRSVKVQRKAGKVPLYRRLMLDGAQYFAIITSSNLVAVVFTTRELSYLSP